MGINPVTTKLWAYAMGAVFGGLAGAYYGAFMKISFRRASRSISILILCAVILGGMGSIYGVILGAVALQGLNFYLLPQMNEWIHAIGDALGSAALSNADVPSTTFSLFGIILVLMMLLRPEGIIPNRQRAEEMHEGDPSSGGAIGGRTRALMGTKNRPISSKPGASRRSSAGWWRSVLWTSTYRSVPLSA